MQIEIVLKLDSQDYDFIILFIWPQIKLNKSQFARECHIYLF